MQASGNTDVLRVIYKREKTLYCLVAKSLNSRVTLESLNKMGDSKKQETIVEVSPALSKSATELHSIVNKKQSRAEQKEVIEDEIHRLEEEISTRVTYLKSLLRSLND